MMQQLSTDEAHFERAELDMEENIFFFFFFFS
jgi:hypothetical protein